MQVSNRVKIFTDKFPLVGPLVWILSVQYFIGQLVVASAWPVAYSWAHNAISDLGNTNCGYYAGRNVCSPDFRLMNISFILLGLMMAVGAWLIYQEFRESRASLVGFSLIALAGLGTILVGYFPENVLHWLHIIGAILALGIGNASLIILALALRRVRRSFRWLTFAVGAVSLIAFILFIFGVNFGLGLGTMERIASYPQTAWLILFGIYMSASHYRKLKSRIQKP